MAVRAKNLMNFRGEPYVTLPQIEQIIGDSMAVKVVRFRASAMTASEGSLQIVVPGVVIGLFNATAGSVCYMDMQYGNNANEEAQTLLTIEGYAESDIVTEGANATVFVATTLVKTDGTPSSIDDDGSYIGE